MENFIRILSELNIIPLSYAATIEDTPVDISNIPIESTGNGFSSLILFLIAFILITGIMLLLFISINKKNSVELKSNKSIQILDNIKIDHNSNLLIIKIQNKVHVLGKTDNSISLISTLENKDEVDLMEIDCQNKSKYTFQTALSEQIQSIPNIVNNKTQNNFKGTSTSRAFKFNNAKDKE